MVNTPMLKELICEQSKDVDRRVGFSSFGQPSYRFNIDADGILVQTFPLHSASKRYVPATTRARVLFLCHHSLLAAHPGERRTYDSMGKELFWPHMANDVYATVRHWHSCTKSQIHGKRQPQLKLFYSDRSLYYVSMDILGLLPRTNKGARLWLHHGLVYRANQSHTNKLRNSRRHLSQPPQTLGLQLLYLIKGLDR